MIAKHRNNLIKLRDFLVTVPPDRFNMREFLEDEHGEDLQLREFATHNPQHTCGTAACAIGWAPNAGIRIYRDRSWFDYAERVFGTARYQPPYEWMFGPEWARKDNTPAGAARRITYFLEHGVPAEDSPLWKTSL